MSEIEVFISLDGRNQRLGTLRFKTVGNDEFQKPTDAGVPSFIQLARLLDSAERIERNSETDEDLDLIFALGFSLDTQTTTP